MGKQKNNVLTGFLLFFLGLILLSIFVGNMWVAKELNEQISEEPAVSTMHTAQENTPRKYSKPELYKHASDLPIINNTALNNSVKNEDNEADQPVKKIYELPLDDTILVQ